MGTKAPDRAGELPPERVIAWLRTPAGERWSERRIGSDLGYWGKGAFGDVVPDSWGASAVTSWPEPMVHYDLDNPHGSWQ